MCTTHSERAAAFNFTKVQEAKELVCELVFERTDAQAATDGANRDQSVSSGERQPMRGFPKGYDGRRGSVSSILPAGSLFLAGRGWTPFFSEVR